MQADAGHGLQGWVAQGAREGVQHLEGAPQFLGDEVRAQSDHFLGVDLEEAEPQVRERVEVVRAGESARGAHAAFEQRDHLLHGDADQQRA